MANAQVAAFPSVEKRDRLTELSTPKKPKSEWCTSFGPRVTWGSQDLLWPIKKTALTAEPTERIQILSLPKVNLQTGNNNNRPLFLYSSGRPSALWEVSPLALKAATTERLRRLATPKQANLRPSEDAQQFMFSCGRASPIWMVRSVTMHCPERPRTTDLAQTKELHNSFVSNRQVATVITPSALRATPTGRLTSLSTHRERSSGPFRSPEWPVTTAAKNATASTRCMELAKPKNMAEGYQSHREVEWAVTRAAKRAVPTARINEISEPIVRASMDHVQFNPDAFLVKHSALKGMIPARIQDLSQPIHR